MGPPTPGIDGEPVSLGPLRRNLVGAYARWLDDFETLRTLNVTPRPTTHEQGLAWYEGQAKIKDSVHFVIHERRTLPP